MKKFVIGLLFGAMLMFSVNAFAKILFVESPLSLFTDGKKLDRPVYILNNETYIPLQAVPEEFLTVTDKQILITTSVTDTEAVAEKCKDSCVMVYAYTKTHQKQGSGFVYNGYVITAKHVVEGATRINIFTNDEKYGVTGVVHYTHPTLDLAVIKAYTNKPSVVLGDSDKLTEGQKLISITSPNGTMNSIDECLFSGLGDYDKGKFITISESEMASGSSGGATFNPDGEVVAITTNGIGASHLAIPINSIKSILEGLK